MSVPTGRRIAWLEPSRFPYGYDDQNIYSGILFPRAGPKMTGLLRSLGYEVEVISGELSPIDPDQIARDFDLACISVISNTAPHGLVLGRWLTERGVPVVMGGYQFAHRAVSEATLQPTHDALDFVPYVIRGEGYQALPQFLAAWEGRADWRSVPGLSYRDDAGTIRHNEVAPPLTPEEFCALPLADWTAIRDRQKMKVGAVHGLLGCPRACSWCAVWPRDGNGLRHYAATAFVDELEGLLSAGDFWHVFFSADNFPVIHPWAKAVCEEILRRGVDVEWTCQSEVGAYRRTELVDLMVKAGCKRWCLGLESINKASLEDSNKRQDRELMEACLADLRRRGVQVHGMFIVGLPHDTPETVRQTADWAMAQGIETCQFLCLVDLPGSQDYETQALWDQTFRPFTGALEPLNWIFANGHYARLATSQMTLTQVQDAMISAMNRFYSLPRVLGALARPHAGSYQTAREAGHGRLASLRLAWRESVRAAFLRARGYRDTRRWLRAPFNRAYRALLTATGAEADRLRAAILAELPAEWVRTLEAVHAERLARAPLARAAVAEA